LKTNVIHFLITSHPLLLRMGNVSDKIVENIKTNTLCSVNFFPLENRSVYEMMWKNTGLFIIPSGNSELDCATTKTDTAERSMLTGRESLKVYFCTRGLGVLAGSTARG